LPERSIWAGIKARLLLAHRAVAGVGTRRDICQFVTRRRFAKDGVDQAIEFVDYRFRHAAANARSRRENFRGQACPDLLQRING